MQSHQDRITGDMKAAMKAGDKKRLQVLRMLINAFKDEQLRSGKDQLDEATELEVLRRAVKTRREAVDQARQLGRDDVADAEAAEVAIVQDYLPAMMSPDELAAKVRELADEIGYSGPSDKGRFMKEWMARYRGQAEGRDVQAALGAL